MAAILSNAEDDGEGTWNTMNVTKAQFAMLRKLTSYPPSWLLQGNWEADAGTSFEVGRPHASNTEDG